MKLKEQYHRLLIICISLLFLLYGKAHSQHGLVQDDPVLAPNAVVAPTIDGIGDDACWQYVPWQSIDQVWIPYGDAMVDSADYYGRYKVVWSSTANLLYFLMEVTDDVFVDGYPNGGGAIYDNDISEVFIDENKSGGLHIFDGKGSDTLQFGTNAENAFSYHMYAALPAAGQVTKQVYVDDLAGTSWGDSWRPDYTSHFPEFALRVTGHTAVREFSLIVYNDTYDNNNKDASRSQLVVGKEMGLSVAYCDNDDPNENPKVRDNMFGSVWEPSPGNLHWQNADYYGSVKLVAAIPSSVESGHTIQINPIRLYPNPASSNSQLQLDNSYRGEVSIRLFNLLGQEVFRTMGSKADRLFTQSLVLNRLPSGFYFIQTRMGKSIFCEKLIITQTK
ncbi:MAG: sugar-binding protein [Bacteroidota bacterium]